ncbi:MAG: hypothetical protein A2846_02065 [Candidatus Doudnabacteria bacterium RIFCSPHIGHO2_01_FULL_49_9]|uniref:Uncharacterized protein n=1 Tax=Candidatus Doudnabacteria bacterium RIFCSPHIGHO2_01_FULL_49_9 TaxID=1817827 RepID=A0A1F5P382_9BACT|nr:MAG: hypothetical protein A2846_02065 [Candidatus Doudnabacteria bacterium RIFCSPHIGHO2_01_FULL_49_9]
MAKIFVVSLLLMLVYSWEEFKYYAKFFLRLLLYRNKIANLPWSKTADRFVSASIGLAMLPIGLSIFLESHPFSGRNLLWLAASMLIIAVIAWYASAIIKYLSGLRYYSSLSVGASAIYDLAALSSPQLLWFSDFDLVERKALAKFAAYLSLPAIVGLVLKFTLGQSYVDERFLPGLDLLIQILVMALFINVTISILKKHLHSRQMSKIFHLFRVVLGILLSAALLIPQN